MLFVKDLIFVDPVSHTHHPDSRLTLPFKSQSLTPSPPPSLSLCVFVCVQEDETPIKNFVKILGRDLVFIWEDQKLGEVLAEFRKGRTHMAIVQNGHFPPSLPLDVFLYLSLARMRVRSLILSCCLLRCMTNVCAYQWTAATRRKIPCD